MNSFQALGASLLAALLLVVCMTLAQGAEPQRTYVAVECMQSTAPDYADLEETVWLPMHQVLVDSGQRNSWALYRVLYGDQSRCDHYAVTTFSGDEQLNSIPDWQAVFERAHPGKNSDKAMERTWAARRMLATELWIMVDSTSIGEHRYAVVNTMNAADPDAYERMESRVFKPGHQALVDAGHRAGWALYTLVSPVGSAIPYNYSTVDFSNQLSPVPMAEAMLQAHPDRDLDALQDMLRLREHVNSQTWVRVTGTRPRD